MAEAWLNRLGGHAFAAESAGLEAGTMKPLVIQAMREAGMDLSTRGTQTVFEVLKSGRRFDYVVILCDPKRAERCPVFPGEAARMHWDIPERPKAPASLEDQLGHVRTVRDLIKTRVQAWVIESA